VVRENSLTWVTVEMDGFFLYITFELAPAVTTSEEMNSLANFRVHCRGVKKNGEVLFLHQRFLCRSSRVDDPRRKNALAVEGEQKMS